MRTGLTQSTYRLIYNAIAALSLVPVLAALRSAPVHAVSNGWNGSVWMGTVLMSIGALIGLVALNAYDLREFVGLSSRDQSDQVRLLRQNGLLRYVRHPLYLGIVVVLLGLLVYQPDWKHLTFGLAAFLYIRIGIYYEERKLIRVFGNQYLNYRKRTPMLIPFTA